MKRNLSIDLIKTIAMIMVLGLHIFLTKQISPSFILKCNYGYNCIGVPLFFMVSGYLLIQKNLTFKYSINKIKGILKFVLLTITIILIVDFLLYGTFSYRDYYKWIIQRGHMWQYWYFASMIIIYFLLPLLQKIIRSEYLLPVFILLVIICFVFFLLNSFFQFEKKYVAQSFRVWYWLLYFVLGAIIKQYQYKLKWIRWIHAMFMCVIYTIFQISGFIKAGGNEYFFGSFICMLYAISVFCACLNINIKKSTFISTMSSLFLPVYAVHPIIMGRVISKMDFLSAIDNSFIQYFVIYIISAAITITFSYFLMKIPYIKNIFQI
ncbi:MAG TPA: hypothetical protein DCW44_07860 [Eubacterium sp.]|nr:hypothetical protein [Eubacterium sp.]